MSPPGVRGRLLLRPLEPEDASDLARLQSMPGFRSGTLRPPFPRVSGVRQFLSDLGPDDLLLGAFLDLRLVGTAGLQRSTGRRRHVAALGMGVADDMTGQGIGTALLRAILDAADNWMDIRRIELTVFADNHHATRLYERFGFAPEGMRRAFAYRDGRYVDAISMARLRIL